MPRFAFKLEYNGARYCGWQRQAGQKTVQGVVEAALHQLEPDGADLTAAGRTDSGVHAWGQVAHADLAGEWDPLRLREALNAHLGKQRVGVLDVARVDHDFHARHSAVQRVYVYRILSRRAAPAVEHGLFWHRRYMLDKDAMQEAAGHLVGRHDFTTFRSAHCQAASPVRTLDSLEIDSYPYHEGREFRFVTTARSFLHRQVRSMVGSLERVGAGAISPDDIRSMLEACDRSRCGPVGQAKGLYLAKILYPTDPFGQKVEG